MKLIRDTRDNKYLYVNDDYVLQKAYQIDVTDDIWSWAYSSAADYCLRRENIKRIVETIGWDNVEHKDEVVNYCGTTGENIVSYFMSKGYSLQEAQQQYALKRIVDVQNAAKCYCKRAANPELQLYIIIFLGEEQGAVLNNAISNFKHQLCEIALLGTGYGDSSDGIMDFIESTGSYTSGGLKSFTFTDEVVNQYGSEDAARMALISIFQKYIISGGY